MIELNFAPLPLSSDSISVMFNTFEELCEWLSLKYEDTLNSKVFLFTHEGECYDNEILISEHEGILFQQMLCIAEYPGNKMFYWQEYESYEDAYAVALTMKEDNPLCYKKGAV